LSIAKNKLEIYYSTKEAFFSGITEYLPSYRTIFQTMQCTVSRGFSAVGPDRASCIYQFSVNAALCLSISRTKHPFSKYRSASPPALYRYVRCYLSSRHLPINLNHSAQMSHLDSPTHHSLNDSRGSCSCCGDGRQCLAPL